MMITRNELTKGLKEEVKELEQAIEQAEDTYCKMYINSRLIEVKRVIAMFDEGTLLANTFRLLSHIIDRAENEEGEKEELTEFTIEELQSKIEKLQGIAINNDAFLSHDLEDRYLNNNDDDLNCEYMGELVANLKFNLIQLASIGIYL